MSEYQAARSSLCMRQEIFLTLLERSEGALGNKALMRLAALAHRAEDLLSMETSELTDAMKALDARPSIPRPKEVSA